MSTVSRSHALNRFACACSCLLLPWAAQAAATPAPHHSASAPAVQQKKPAHPAAKALSTNRSAPVWVALDVGHLPGQGSLSASGLVEHNFNLRFAAALEAGLRAKGLQVKRLPTSLSLADRARRAQGAALLVSVHHQGRVGGRPLAGPAPSASGVRPVLGSSMVVPVAVPAAGSRGGKVDDTGYAVFVGGAQTASLRCAQDIGRALQSTGRHFSEHHALAGAGAAAVWADKGLGILRQGQLTLLQTSTAPALMLDVANIARPAEEALARDPLWVRTQAAAVAKGVARCLAPSGRKV